MREKKIYFDNSATTRPYDKVIEDMVNVYASNYGNPSSLHTMGINSEKLIKEARRSIGNELGVKASEVYFTSGGTESNSLAVEGYINANLRKGNHLVTSKTEHPSVLEIFKYYENNGFTVDYINVDHKGMVDLEELDKKISDKTLMASIMMVNNETGTIQPIEKISRIVKKNNRDTVLHVDAVQAFGKIRTNPGISGIDMMSLSSHKIHGPKGTGALFVKKGFRLNPILIGGGQEASMRSGTENVPGISGFGIAAGICFQNIEDTWEKVSILKGKLKNGLLENLDCIEISPEHGSPYILNMAFEGVKAEVLLHHLAGENIFVSTGSACSSRKNIRSHVLSSMGTKNSYIDSAIRFSFSIFNELEEVNITLGAIKNIVPKIKTKR